ncbi:diaminopimelate epimerase [Bacillus sp. JJ1521]|uniref:diaminopimelate epimerase n=1 Tax=Bacillus sp. JJ1521 TaxID=3122957 RepID=UPI002FFE0CE7
MLFTKMHGLGNNYIFFNLLECPLEEQKLSALAKAVSDVNFGIGSDGMILILPSEIADFRMRIFNADGSEGKNCGNGLRCVGKFLVDHLLVEKNTFSIETLGGIVDVTVQTGTNHVAVDMGEPKLRKELIPMKGESHSTTINQPFTIDGKEYHLTCVSMGNPHAIIFVDDVKAFPLEKVGPLIEHSELFPERVNVGIVHVKDGGEIDYRVWERGSGITMACATGACAAVVASILNGKIAKHRPVTVHLPGGDLEVTWDINNHIWQKGEAAYICHGEINLQAILYR